jgi:hypothetical protein
MSDTKLKEFREHTYLQTPFGEGVSRAKSGSKTKPFVFTIKANDATFPMRLIIPAENKKAAIFYVNNRWPEAKVILHD